MNYDFAQIYPEGVTISSAQYNKSEWVVEEN